jgi:nicotinate-nucleotide adenylyltransferase
LIGIFGGTFDPVHLGHTFVIKEFKDSVDFDKLILIPNGNPPHKEKNVYEQEKLEMTELALGNIANLTIDDREVKKKAPSYAYLTLQELKKENPDDILVWIMGSDSFANIDTWYCYEEFIDEVNLLVLERPGYSIQKQSIADNILRSKQTFDLSDLKKNNNKIFLLKINPIEINSTEIRKLIANNEDAAEFLHPNVYQFIKTNNLYKN